MAVKTSGLLCFSTRRLVWLCAAGLENVTNSDDAATSTSITRLLRVSAAICSSVNHSGKSSAITIAPETLTTAGLVVLSAADRSSTKVWTEVVRAADTACTLCDTGVLALVGSSVSGSSEKSIVSGVSASFTKRIVNVCEALKQMS